MATPYMFKINSEEGRTSNWIADLNEDLKTKGGLRLCPTHVRNGVEGVALLVEGRKGTRTSPPLECNLPESCLFQSRISTQGSLSGTIQPASVGEGGRTEAIPFNCRVQGRTAGARAEQGGVDVATACLASRMRAHAGLHRDPCRASIAPLDGGRAQPAEDEVTRVAGTPRSLLCPAAAGRRDVLPPHCREMPVTLKVSDDIRRATGTMQKPPGLAATRTDTIVISRAVRRLIHRKTWVYGGGWGARWLSERLARSPSTKANRVQSPTGSPNFRKWESCRTMPLVGGFSRGSPSSPVPSLRRRSILTSIILIGSQDLAVKSHPNLFTSSLAVGLGSL
ncbi:hypothetical protein PR048_019325 [Dryococelus australis]|uniref:Uncharacterized protein n=1 Tax=Dryococelus australis TaxID=614101 RepID=A0ABQ9H3A2_9NEOP|nr:hypothetical protein PR048_019325 [Dryococelus australis]